MIAHDDQVKCYSLTEYTNVKIIWKISLQSLWYDVYGGEKHSRAK